jgi:hypothetical protein
LRARRTKQYGLYRADSASAVRASAADVRASTPGPMWRRRSRSVPAARLRHRPWAVHRRSANTARTLTSP